MPTISMRASLQKIGEPKSGKTIPSFPSGFHSAPKSLRAALHAMNPPLIEQWILSPHQSVFENKTWTEECQGLTTDGNAWYISSNNADFRAIHKFSLDFALYLGFVKLPTGGEHIGDIDYHDGKIYVPVSDGAFKIWVIGKNLNTLEIADLSDEDPHFSMGWCAINPWNGYLYTSPGNNVDRLHAYDPNNNFTYKGFLLLEGNPVNGLQGACFSTNGHLYLTSDLYAYTNDMVADKGVWILNSPEYRADA